MVNYCHTEGGVTSGKFENALYIAVIETSFILPIKECIPMSAYIFDKTLRSELSQRIDVLCRKACLRSVNHVHQFWIDNRFNRYYCVTIYHTIMHIIFGSTFVMIITPKISCSKFNLEIRRHEHVQEMAIRIRHKPPHLRFSRSSGIKSNINILVDISF